MYDVTQEDDGESFQATIVEPASVATKTRILKVLLNSEIDTPVGHNDDATLVKTHRSRKG